ncbi:hypothetical protein PAPHI01_2503 [Pancytospora philotis]|nr:hypothetical protein PAPHI01_2503 [Pancytospora philotis]
MSMLYVQLGREVAPRRLVDRMHKAVIVGIKNYKFVVIMKQDKTKEIVRVRDIVLVDRVYDMEDLSKSTCEFYTVEKPAPKTNDFDRYLSNLRTKIVNEMVKEKGL